MVTQHTRAQHAQSITSRAQDYAQWYLDIIAAADLAEHGDVKGTMIIKPYGYAIWERMQHILDDKIKETGHQNAYFPMFIPKSFLSREATHVEGFAKECAVVTHHRLMNNPNGEGVVVDPESKLEEELVVRPTSETVIHAAFARWIKSWRDLPLLINQWANVVRWEMRTRLFLRTSEFLWQEGHTAHATEADAEEEARKMLDMYAWFAREVLAMEVIPGEKSESERFAGALRTYTIEAMMQDGKALQSGTSHNLGQNFAKAFEVKFLDQDNQQQYCWMTSWGVSTRLMGALIMSHSDDKGLVLPPEIAPYQVVVLPLWKKEEEKAAVMEQVSALREQLQHVGVRVHIDARDYETFGTKVYGWEKKGVPVRIEIGPRDLAQNQVMMARRDTGEKKSVAIDQVASEISTVLEAMQKALFASSQQRLQERTVTVDSYETFKTQIETGGFFLALWCGSAECETRVKEETKATIRCIPFEKQQQNGKCMICNAATSEQVIFARAY